MFRELQASEYGQLFGEFGLQFVAAVDDEADGGGEGAVKLYLRGIFVPCGSIHFLEDEALHGVDVD